MNLIFVLLCFSLIIILHELGHYWAALKAGVQVLSFQIGFGPTLLSKKNKTTSFSLKLFPLGGGVILAGLDEGSGAKVPPQNKYSHKSLAQRFWIIFCGSLMNILLGIFIFVIIYSVVGIPQNITNTIAYAVPGRPAQLQGLKSGDQILAINGRQGDIQTLIKLIHQTKPEQKISLTLSRNNQVQTKLIPTYYNTELKLSNIGIVLKPGYYKRVNFFQAVWLGLVEAFSFGQVFISGLGQLFFHFDLENFSGPVGILQYSNEAMQYGLTYFLRFFAIISLNIGLLNLLPFPALDGGRLVFLLWELIFRRPAGKNLEKYVHLIGFMVLLSLIFVVTYHDIIKLFKK